MTTKTARTGFKVGDLITYPGFPDESYQVTRRYGCGTCYDLVDSHHCTIIRVSLTGCKLVAS
jgi:hypothetical protein